MTLWMGYTFTPLRPIRSCRTTVFRDLGALGQTPGAPKAGTGKHPRIYPWRTENY
jgi:hypothetical protein